jgi:chemotaxis protein MotB
MATFSDLVTLLLTFFVMLMSMANFDDPTKVNAVLSSLRDQLGADGFDAALLGPGDGKHMNPTVGMDVSLSPLLANLGVAFRQHLSDAVVEIDAEQDELRVDLPEGAFFREDSAEVHPNGYLLLAQVGDLMATEESVVVDVIGYAAPGEGLDPRLMGARRAVAVIGRLREKVGGERMSATAYGPDAPDPTSGAGAWNRRIGLVFRTDQARGRGPLNDLSDAEDPDGRR